MKTILKNARVINEGKIWVTDLLIERDRIAGIAPEINVSHAGIVDCEGKYLMPGMIDAQVHFREPGLTYKADIASETRAAVAGGITSFMDMPNTIPAVLNKEAMEEKFRLAARDSLANYSFFMGVSRSNWEEALRTDPATVCGLSDDGLYLDDSEANLSNDPAFLEFLFARCPTLIALHCEDHAIIARNTMRWGTDSGMDPCGLHARLRSAEACLEATKRVLAAAGKYGNRLHLLHISTPEEALILDNKLPVREKRVTGEACLPHLYFSDQDYGRLGNRIKWNPAVKTAADKIGLMRALLTGHLDTIATDHAPHLWAEKEGSYLEAKSGGPLVQHALPMLLELYQQGQISLTQLVEKTSHHVAEVYRILDRGYIREGYYADLVLVDPVMPAEVTAGSLYYKCGWSPLEGQTFQSMVTHTWVNGRLVFHKGKFNESARGMRLGFERDR